MDKEKKIWYSSPLNFYWKELYGKQKKYTPYYSDENIFTILRSNIINAPLSESLNNEKMDLLLTGLELWKEDLEGNFLHIYFLEKYLRDFLEKTPLTDLEGIRKYLYENGIKKRLLYIKTKEQIDCVVYSFGLHIPYETNGYAFTMRIFENNTVELFFSHDKNNGELSDIKYTDINKKTDHKSIAMSKMFRLAFNTIAYMKCFPECVTDGVPKITYGIDEIRSNKNFTFQISEIVTDSKHVKLSKLPHFRKGYFKLLRSDFYTNKKGQIIFIPETMVKGKAKTVSTSTELDKL
jgi:hypothetical protein